LHLYHHSFLLVHLCHKERLVLLELHNFYHRHHHLKMNKMIMEMRLILLHLLQKHQSDLGLLNFHLHLQRHHLLRQSQKKHHQLNLYHHYYLDKTCLFHLQSQCHYLVQNHHLHQILLVYLVLQVNRLVEEWSLHHHLHRLHLYILLLNYSLKFHLYLLVQVHLPHQHLL
jgi:hypothetical protein